MIKTDDKHFMVIEPKQKATLLVNDVVTELARKVMLRAKPTPGSQTRGFHTCVCGENSDNREWKMPDGRITTSLTLHYVDCHRSEIPREEMVKLLAYARDFNILNVTMDESYNDGVYPKSLSEYVLEVRDALGHWCRLRDTKPSLRLMNLHLEVIWGKEIPWDGIRIVEIKTTESLLTVSEVKEG